MDTDPGTAARRDDENTLRTVGHLRLPGDAVFVTDGEGRIRAASRSTVGVLGFVPGEIVGSRLVDLVAPDDAPRLVELAVASSKSPEPAEPETIRFRHAVTGWRPCEVLVGRALDRDGAGLDGYGIVLRDVTHLDAARRALRSTEAQLQAAVEHASDVVLTVETDGRIRDVSPGVSRAVGYAPDEVRRRNLFDLIHPDDLEGVRACFAEAERAAPEPEQEADWTVSQVRLRHRDGSWRLLETAGRSLVHVPEIGAVVVSARDVTERHRLGRLLDGQTQVIERLADREPLPAVLAAVADLVEQQADEARVAVFRSVDGWLHLLAGPRLPSAWCRMAERVRDEAVDDPPVERGAAPLDGALARLAADHELGFGWAQPVLEPGAGRRLGLVVLFAGTKRFPTAAERTVLHIASTLAAVAIERDVTARTVRWHAVHDPLTGLIHRGAVHDALLDFGRAGEPLAVLVADLDGFTAVNERFGIGAGDLVLRVVADRLRDAVRSRDLLGRLGDDEFVVIARSTPDVAAATVLAERLVEAVRPPIRVRDVDVVVPVSVGVAIDPTGVDPERLLLRAQTAVRTATSAGGARIEVDRVDQAAS